MTILQTYLSYHIGSDWSLTQLQVRQLISGFNQPIRSAGAYLAGRAAAVTLNLSGVGPVVIKHYTRGGVIRQFITQTYFRIGKTRSQLEYELLFRLKKLGINAPEPVAYAFKGRLLYQAWIMTREIEDTQTLSALSLNNPAQAKEAIHQLGPQVQRLIDNHIHHVDLHPGNVLVTRTGKIYLIDFDKAKTVTLPAEVLKAKYISRWRRAVDKHHLPQVIRELF
jgi:3-deoxy-D-manno-octulosonic acid kinase